MSELNEIKDYLPMDASDKGRITQGTVLGDDVPGSPFGTSVGKRLLQLPKNLWIQRHTPVDPDYEGMFTFAGDNSPEVITRMTVPERGWQTHNMPRNSSVHGWHWVHSNKKKPPQDMVDTYDCIDGLPH